MNNKFSDRKRNILLSIIVLFLGLIIVGGTYAALSITLDVSVVNGVYELTTECFELNYNSGSSIKGTLFPSSTYANGLFGDISLGIKENCNVIGSGELEFIVHSNSDRNGILTKTVDAHCENPSTLSTLTEYTTESDCTDAGGSWVEDGTALKYAVLVEDLVEPVSLGYIKNIGETISLYKNFPVDNTVKNYTIYVWLDGNLIDNSYANVSFSGEISTTVQQKVFGGNIFVIYSADDNSLRFYSNSDEVLVGDIYNGRIVTAVYTDVGHTEYDANSIPWSEYKQKITNVSVEEEIRPLSTAYWFRGFYNCSSFDLNKLNTSSVTNMSYMFEYVGYYLTTLSVDGLSEWDVSNVTDMSYMFNYAFLEVASIDIDLIKWDVSKVVNMNNMFSSVGKNATTMVNVNLTGWDVSNVTDMGYMFYRLGMNSNEIMLSGLSNWDVSNVTNMEEMFYCVGCHSEIFELDLSKWDVSSVKNMRSMFNSIGRSATTWSIGNLSSWDTSSVTNMSSMFFQVGEYVETIELGLSNWDVSNVTDMSSMFLSSYLLGEDLSNWDVSNVTNMNGMFYGIHSKVETVRLDLSGWDVSNVTTMKTMFYSAGYDVVDFELNLSGWDTSNVTDVGKMFSHVGCYDVKTTLNMDLTGWDLSSVTDMGQMFDSAGYSATTVNIDLTGWDVSNVTDMNYMFSTSGYSAQTYVINGLIGWDVSNVTTMIGMFDSAGANASYTLNLTGWNVENVTSYANFERGVENKINSPVWRH